MERAEVNTARFRRTALSSRIQEMFPVRQENRKRMTRFSGTQLGEWRDGASRSAHLKQAATGKIPKSSSGKNDSVIACPKASLKRGSIAQCLGGAAGALDLLKFALSKECNVAAIRRPERCSKSAFRSSQRPRFDRFHRTDPKPGDACRSCDEGQLAAIR